MRNPIVSAAVRRSHSAPVIHAIVCQHAEALLDLYVLRSAATESGGVQLRDLSRVDKRIAAHIDGLSVAGDQAWPVCEACLESPGAAAAFPAAVWALDHHPPALDSVFTLAAERPDVLRSVAFALAWVDSHRLQGVVARLLREGNSLQQSAAISGCAAHGVDPGLAAERWIRHPDAPTRRRALKAIGELGLRAAAPAVSAAMRDEDAGCRFWAAWASVLLGDRGPGLEALIHDTADEAHRARAFPIALQTLSPGQGHALLQGFARDPQQLRKVVQGSGIVGDPAYVPWLIGHMRNPEMARLAGEAFALVTGADLLALNLETTRPEKVQSAANDDPDDANVCVDPDEGLPWPDPHKVEEWWARNCHRFQRGERYFMGGPVTREHCIGVLKNGYQRQRVLAAQYLCLLDPGTPLVNTSAPAWRQQKLLAHMQ
jgi:uncharacterized protein (TIGR02270 family)